MTFTAGLDLGYGSQIKIVKTNYLIVGAHTQGTAQAHANLLTLFNREQMENARGGAHLVADYIMSADGSGSGALAAEGPTSGTDQRVLSSAALTKIPVMGPSYQSLATQADLSAADNMDTEDDMGSHANGNIISVLSYSQITFRADFGGALVVLDTIGGTGSMVQDLNSRLESAKFGSTTTASAKAGKLGFLDFTEVFDTVKAGVTGNATFVMSQANLNASFVEKGNAAGTTPTELSDLGDFVDDTCAMVSVTALVSHA